MRKLKLPLLIVLVLAFAACKKEVNPDKTTDFQLSNQKSVVNGVLPSSYTAANWMGAIADQTNLAKLSIPGTHDAGATQEPISGTAKCQNLSIADQLNAGVRYLDIRCRHIDNGFAIYHGAIYQKLNFTDVLNACLNFLNSNPTETIIMSVKEEHTPSGNTRSFEETFNSYVQQNPSKWDLGNTVPSLGSLRGKIKLLRRFAAAGTKGIDATNWADNTVFEINNAASAIKIQDFYNVNDTDSKWAKMETLLNEAKNDASNKLYLNYGSGYKAGIFGIPNINTIANAINPKVTAFFTANKSGRFGIIPLDFIDADRSKLILNTNF